MIRPLSTTTLLLASTLLYAPAVLAQSGAGGVQAATPPAPATTAQSEAPEEEVEISGPGALSAGDEDIVVRGRFIPNAIRATPEVISVLSTADIARTGEGDIAGALTRITGLSVVGNGFVFVRGLGDRYSAALLNGSPLPSPEPLRRTVPLDIFPTSIVGSAVVQKSYSVNYPAEFGGGVINLTTVAIPKESFISAGASLGIDTQTTGRQGLTYYGSSGDVIGFDNGERDVPAVIRQNGLTRDQFFPQEIIGFSGARTSLVQSGQIPANMSLDFNAGHDFDLGDARLGVIASAGFSNSWRTRNSTQQETIDTAGVLRGDFQTQLTDNRIALNGLFGLAAELGEHKLRWSNVYIHDTLKQARFSSATLYENSSGDPILRQNTNFFERQLINTQLVGEFRFGDVALDLRGSYANTKRLAPYERSFSYRFDRFANRFVNSLTGQQENATIAFSRLNEDLYSGQADVSYKLPTARSITLSAGGYYSDQSRESTRFEYRYIPVSGGPVSFPFNTLRADNLLSAPSILNGCASGSVVPAEQGCIGLRRRTESGAARYDASLKIRAGYVQGEAEFLDGVKATVGVRYEDANETVRTAGFFPQTSLKNDYFLPAGTVTWNFAEDMQLRLHGSKTIARPQFRELAPQLYRDFESDRNFFGNPRLVDSRLTNFEARYEWFLGRDERITAAGFYKDIKNPVEQVATFPTQESGLQTNFSYAPKAELFGGEIEIQKYFALDRLDGDFWMDRRFLVVANYTYTQSKLKVDNSLVPDPIQDRPTAQFVAANTIFRDGSPLTGQSDHLVNFQVGLEKGGDLVSQQTLLFSYASERVTNRGALLLPDIKEKPGIRVDFVAREQVEMFGGLFEIKLEARNLTGTKYQEFQQFEDRKVFFNRYKLGRMITLGLSSTF